MIIPILPVAHAHWVRCMPGSKEKGASVTAATYAICVSPPFSLSHSHTIHFPLTFQRPNGNLRGSGKEADAKGQME